MRRLRLLPVTTVICLLGPTVLGVTPASAAQSLTVLPNGPYIDRQSVLVSGTGFPAEANILICETVVTAGPSLDDCAGPGPNPGTIAEVGSSSTGTFDDVATNVRRLVYAPSLGRTVDCAIEACYLAAGVKNDFGPTATFAPIAFKPGQPDGRIMRRSDGEITGDNVYEDTTYGLGIQIQRRTHTIAPGGYWTYALQVQSDGPNTDDITVTAPSTPAGTQFFYGYFDVTSKVTGPGAIFSAMAPGEVRTFALRFHAPADATAGMTFGTTVRFICNSSGADDFLSLRVVVQTPTL